MEWHKRKRKRKSLKTLTPDLGTSIFTGLVNSYQEFNILIKLEIKTKVLFFVIQGPKTCRGSIVTKSMVLTAAHCLMKVNADESVSVASAADITVHHGKNCCFCQQFYEIIQGN